MSILANLAEKLRSRLRARTERGKTFYQLNLRAEAWGNLGVCTLRDPSARGWPHKGATTDDEAKALLWIYDPSRSDAQSYARWVDLELARAGVQTEGVLTLTRAAERYVANLTALKGANHNTTQQRRSQLDVHIRPKALGGLPLAALPKATVREFLNSLTVNNRRDGVTVEERASIRTKGALRTALLEIWADAYPDTDCPFAGIALDNSAAEREARERLERGIQSELEVRDSYTRDEVLRLLATAMWLDRVILGLPRYRGQLPIVAAAVALYLGTGARLEELLMMRWWMLDEARMDVMIPGTKGKNGRRYLPHFDSLRPWVRILQEAQPRRTPQDHVLRTFRKKASKPSDSTWSDRVARVEELAGLKIPGKRAHIFRVVWINWALDEKELSDAYYKLWAGHALIKGGASDQYIKQMRDRMPENYRSMLAQLPSPEEVEALLDAGFVPPCAHEMYEPKTLAGEPNRKARRDADTTPLKSR
jgi:integrase